MIKLKARLLKTRTLLSFLLNHQSPIMSGTIKMNTFLYKKTSPEFLKLVPIDFKNPKASPMPCERKKIHANVTKIKVVSICLSSFKFGNFRSCATTLNTWIRFLFNNSKGKKPQAWIPPQTIKFQLAPCQKPLTKKMMNVFLTAFHLPVFEPPKGIYK